MSNGFSRVDGHLQCDGVALADAAARFGTPLYVYSRAAVEEAYGAYTRAFAKVRHRIHYAVKANACLGLLRVLRELGAGVDVVSVFELLDARRAGSLSELQQGQSGLLRRLRHPPNL